jgi:hypothetical protein
MHNYRLCLVTVRVKVMQNGRVLRLPENSLVSHVMFSSLSGVPRGGGIQTPSPTPRKSEFLTKLSRIPNSKKNTSVKPNQNTGFIHLQVEWNPWLGGYRPPDPRSLWVHHCPASAIAKLKYHQTTMVSFESRVINRFPTPSFLKKLEDVPHEERGIIPL